MPAPIARYHLVDFGSVAAATAGAAKLLQHTSQGHGMRFMTGPRRAVIWGAGPEAPAAAKSCLYLSDGGLEAARELKLDFTLNPTPLPAAELPSDCTLIMGDPRA